MSCFRHTIFAWEKYKSVLLYQKDIQNTGMLFATLSLHNFVIFLFVYHKIQSVATTPDQYFTLIYCKHAQFVPHVFLQTYINRKK